MVLVTILTSCGTLGCTLASAVSHRACVLCFDDIGTAFLGCVGGDGTVRTRVYIFRLVAVPGSGDGRHGCECAFVNVWEAEGRVEKNGGEHGQYFCWPCDRRDC